MILLLLLFENTQPLDFVALPQQHNKYNYCRPALMHFRVRVWVWNNCKIGTSYTCTRHSTHKCVTLKIFLIHYKCAWRMFIIIVIHEELHYHYHHWHSLSAALRITPYIHSRGISFQSNLVQFNYEVIKHVFPPSCK